MSSLQRRNCDHNCDQERVTDPTLNATERVGQLDGSMDHHPSHRYPGQVL